MKRCLKKTIGGARLTYDELLTVVSEVEMILNSQPLSYISSQDIKEHLTPSHLMIGRRVLPLPDLPFYDRDPDYRTKEDLSRRNSLITSGRDGEMDISSNLENVIATKKDPQVLLM